MGKKKEKVRDRLGNLFHNKMKFSGGLKTAEITDEDWCKTCWRENNGQKVKEKILHATYSCPSVIHVRQEILREFSLIDPNNPINSGSVVLATVLYPNTLGNRNLSDLINLIWSIATSEILIANKANRIPRADIIISTIKGVLKHIVRVKQDSPVSASLKDRKLLKLLDSGYTPHSDNYEYY